MNTSSSSFPGIVTALFLYALLCAGIGAIILYMWQHVRRILPRHKATPAIRAGEYPLDSDFWKWYDALCAQGDFSYAEAQAWYQLRRHEDIAQMTGEIATEGEAK